MISAPIAFVSRMAEPDIAPWLAALSRALGIEIHTPAQMSPEERAKVEIAIVANPDPADLQQLPGLKWIHSVWAGVERLVSELGPDAPPIVRLIDPELSRTMAEAVLAWTFYLQRDMPAYAAQQAQRLWQQRPYRHPRDVTVGVLGLGQMGLAAAARLQDAGFSVIGWSQSLKRPGFPTHVGEAGLTETLSQSDIVVCLLPLTAQSLGVLNATTLAHLPKGAAVINFGRGPLIDTDALTAALDAGHLSHAVLDVFATEPLPPASPLWGHPKITVLPHISAPTDVTSASAIVAANIRRYLADGTLPETVDRQKGY